MKLVPFESQANLPAYLTEATNLADINKEVVRAAAFPVMSIKGMKFTHIQDGVKKVLTKPDDPDEVAQSIGVVFLRANMHAKTYYAKKYSEGDSDGARPDCYSYDGETPSPNALEPQSKKCAICPHNQWGARVSDDGEAKGKACQDNARLAISTPDNMNPTLLRVPPASLKGLREMLKVVASRKVPYNAVVVKIGFDREAPSPKLTFKPVGLMDDAGYGQIKALYDSEVVRAIVGLDDVAGAEPVEPKASTPKIDADELDAALQARHAANKAKGAGSFKQAQEAKAQAKQEVEDELDDVLATPKKAELKPEPKAKPAPKAEVEDDDTPAPAPKKSGGASDILSDLDDLLGTKDD